jgi:hypothetical protein
LIFGSYPLLWRGACRSLRKSETPRWSIEKESLMAARQKVEAPESWIMCVKSWVDRSELEKMK